VGEHHAVFGLFKDLEPSSTFAYCGCDTINSDETMDVLDMTLNDPSSFTYTLFEGSGLNNVKVNSFPPSIVETKPYAVDEGYLSACCRFVILWMSMPPVSERVHEIDVDVEFDFGPHDGDGLKMFLSQDPTLWRTLMFKKNLNPELLWWFLLLH